MKSPFWIVITEIGAMPPRRFTSKEAAERFAKQAAVDDPESTYYIMQTVSQCKQVGLLVENFDE